MSFDIPLAFTAPTLFGFPQVENLHKVQRASIGDLGPMIYEGEVWMKEPHRKIYDKHVEGWKKALEVPGVAEGGYIVVLHHDTILEDPEALRSLVKAVRDGGYAAAGPRDGDGVMRFNNNGAFYLNTHFIVADPRKVGRWWENGDWDGILSYEDYWLMVHHVLGNILYLETEWREPRLGKATTVLFRGSVVATHLWLSMGDLRVNKGQPTVEGFKAEETAAWRAEFLKFYSEKFGVQLEKCDDTVWSLGGNYSKSFNEIFAGDPRERAEDRLEAPS